MNFLQRMLYNKPIPIDRCWWAIITGVCMVISGFFAALMFLMHHPLVGGFNFLACILNGFNCAVNAYLYENSDK